MKYKFLISACFLAIGLILPLASFATQIDSASVSGLIGYWGFEEATGTTAFDYSGNQKDATLVATTWVAGKRGKALNFNGTSASASAPLTLTGATKFTLSGWVKKSATNKQMSFGMLNGALERAEIVWYTDGSLYGEVGATQDIWGKKAVTNDTKWHFISFVYDGAGATNADKVKLYFDGTPQSSLTFSGTIASSVTCTSTLSIGVRNTGYSSGLIDEVRVYNRALSSAEIASIYNTGVAKINAEPALKKNNLDAGLVGYYTMDNQDINWTTGKIIDKSGTTTTLASLIGLVGATSTAVGKIGQAINLITSSTYIVAPPVQIGANKTVSTWIYQQGTTNVYAPLVEQGGGGVYGNFRLIKYGSRVGFGYDNNVDNFYTTTGGLGTLKKWVHVVGVYDGTSVKIYINGTLNTSSQSLGNYGPWGTNTLNIGFRPYTDIVGGWNGLIDDTRIYNRALSATEVKQLYNQGAGTKVNAAPAVKPLTLDSGLVGYWTMNNQDINWRNLTMTDKSGNGNTGTLVSMPTSTSPVVGKVGQALKFYGGSSYINAGAGQSLQITGDITVAAWVKTFGDTGITQEIVSKNNSTDYELLLVAGLTPRFYTGQNVNEAAANGKILVPNKWTHIVGVHNSLGTMIYVDGLRGTDASIPAPITDNSTGVHIGNRATDNSRPFNGLIDEVKVYNRALSAAEVKQLYNQGK